MVSTIPRQVGLDCIRKVTDYEPGSKPVRCLLPKFLLQVPDLVGFSPCLNYFCFNFEYSFIEKFKIIKELRSNV